MNILILISSLEVGGAEKQAVIDANMLSEKNNKVTIAFSKDGPLSKLLNDNINQVKLFTSNQILVQFHLLYFLILHRFDIIHAHMFWAEKVIAIPSFLTRHKLIYNEHGLGLWRKWYHSKIMKLVSLFAQKVLCSCKLNEKIRFEKDKISKSKLITVYNSISSNLDFTKEKNKIFTIGYCGRFHEVKRLQIFIELAIYCRKNNLKVLFLLVGDGDEFAKITKLVLDNELNEYFEFTGFRLDPKLEYKRMDIFILPSRVEAFSVALLEAGSFGLPLLAFEIGGNSEIVIDNVTGFLIDDNNVEKMFEKINLLYNDRELLHKLSISTKNYIENNFSHASRLEKLEQIYNDTKK